MTKAELAKERRASQRRAERRGERMMLSLGVFQQVAGLAAEGFAELCQSLRVDAFRDGLAHEVVDGLACEPRRLRQRVPRQPGLGSYLFERPADRHGGKIALTERLDNRQSSVYYTFSPELDRDMITAEKLDRATVRRVNATVSHEGYVYVTLRGMRFRCVAARLRDGDLEFRELSEFGTWHATNGDPHTEEYRS